MIDNSTREKLDAHKMVSGCFLRAEPSSAEFVGLLGWGFVSFDREGLLRRGMLGYREESREL